MTHKLKYDLTEKTKEKGKKVIKNKIKLKGGPWFMVWVMTWV